MHSKSGQIAETTTWIVATLIIIVILVVSLYASSEISESARAVNAKKSVIFLKEKNADLLLKQSLFGFLITKNADGKTIYQSIAEKNALSDDEKSLAKDVFVNTNSKENSIAISVNGVQSLLTEKEFSTRGNKKTESMKINPGSELKIILQE